MEPVHSLNRILVGVGGSTSRPAVNSNTTTTAAVAGYSMVDGAPADRLRGALFEAFFR